MDPRAPPSGTGRTRDSEDACRCLFLLYCCLSDIRCLDRWEKILSHVIMSRVDWHTETGSAADSLPRHFSSVLPTSTHLQVKRCCCIILIKYSINHISPTWLHLHTRFTVEENIIHIHIVLLYSYLQMRILKKSHDLLIFWLFKRNHLQIKRLRISYDLYPIK